jgi:enoyl-CoA hydratase
MSSSSPDSLVLSDRDKDGVVTLTMNRPRFNALDLELMDLLRLELAAALAAEARAIVLTGANSCFCAGLDTRALAAYDDSERRRTVEVLNAFVRELYGAPIPTVAAVPGHALAGGLIFALACDRRFVTSEPCKLGLPEVQAGVPYPAVPLLIAKEELGPELTRTLALGGDPLTPQDAVDHGIFDAVVAESDLLNRARAEAAVLAGHPAYTKVKAQLRADVCTRADEIIKTASDPMLQSCL